MRTLVQVAVRDDTGGAGPGLGSLLERLHGAEASFSTVQAAFRIWRHAERAAAAFRAEIEHDRRRGGSISTLTLPGRREMPAEQVETLRIWRSGGRVREEQQGGRRDGHYAIRDGEMWWSWDELTGAVSNEDDPSVGSGVGEQMAVMLDPTPLLGSLRFRVLGRSRVAGRDTIAAEAIPRPAGSRHVPRRMDLHELGTGADLYELEVDSERGVLLKAVALRGGEPFQEITTLEIAFDHPISDEVFHFKAPPGEPVRPLGQHPRPEHITVSEAQQRAEFTVLIPERVPDDWHVHCVFVERSERPRLHPSVLVNYRSEDGHQSVSLSEYAAAEKPEQYELMIAGDGWQTVDTDGFSVQVRRAGSQSQAHMEREGTFVFLTSETFSAERLGAIAAGLKPAE